MTRAKTEKIVEFGDFQTPVALAAAVLECLQRHGVLTPKTVVEPTCGDGAFLVACATAYPAAQLIGYEIDPGHAARARESLPSSQSVVRLCDFFDVAWENDLDACAEPILITGNPPWVTNSALAAINSTNVPAKLNFKGLNGSDARTGKSNFDIAEWMILRMLAAMRARRATLAVLCKSAVARRVIEFAAAKHWGIGPGGLWHIDAMSHFGVAVDAALFVCEVHGNLGEPTSGRWPVYDTLTAETPASVIAIRNGELVADIEKFEATSYLVGDCQPEWRSGLKHDCAKVMELTADADGRWRNGLGEDVDIEAEVVFPLVKSSDVANPIRERSLAVIVPQRALGEDTTQLAGRAPRAWRYLNSHASELRARKSVVYAKQPEFSVFGIGAYSFAPWKIAISGLYKKCRFVLLGPRNGRPVICDDTCYFLPFQSETEARAALSALRSQYAQDFFAARIFWDAKRPINKAILQRLDLQFLMDRLGLRSCEASMSKQGRLAL